MAAALLLMNIILSEARSHQSHSLVPAQGSASGTRTARMRRRMHGRTAGMRVTQVSPHTEERVRTV